MSAAELLAVGIVQRRNDAVLEQLRELHHHVPELRCAAETLGPVTLEHAFGSREPRAVVLHCTNEDGHEGDHRDGNCCWRPHTFTEDMTRKGYRRTPRDLGGCSCGKHKCPTLAILTEHYERLTP